MSDQEPKVGPPQHSRTPRHSEKRERDDENDKPPLGLKHGLIGGITKKAKFWFLVGAGSIGTLLVISMTFGTAITMGWWSTEGLDAWLTFLSWIGLTWLYGQWLKARFGRPNKIFRVQ